MVNLGLCPKRNRNRANRTRLVSLFFLGTRDCKRVCLWFEQSRRVQKDDWHLPCCATWSREYSYVFLHKVWFLPKVHLCFHRHWNVHYWYIDSTKRKLFKCEQHYRRTNVYKSLFMNIKIVVLIFWISILFNCHINDCFQSHLLNDNTFLLEDYMMIIKTTL